MSYKLYLDKPENFTAEVSVKNASLKNSIARLVVEADNGLNLVFKGEIKDGKCIVPIRKLKGLLDENCTGLIQLEVIIEDVYFKPWESQFIVEEHTSLKVQVAEQVEVSSSKPILEVVKVNSASSAKVSNSVSNAKASTSNNKQTKLSIAAKELLNLCERFDISSNNLKTKKRGDFKQLVLEYFKHNREFKKTLNSILNEVVSNL